MIRALYDTLRYAVAIGICGTLAIGVPAAIGLELYNCGLRHRFDRWMDALLDRWLA